MFSEARPRKQRNRLTKACRPCRIRKVKCDMGEPCGTCTKRNHGSLCCYQTVQSRPSPSTYHTGNPSVISQHNRDLSPSADLDHTSLGSSDVVARTPSEATLHNATAIGHDQIATLADLATKLSPHRFENDETTEVIYIGQNASATFFCLLGDSPGIQPASQSEAIRIASAFCLTNRTVLHPFSVLWAPNQRDTLLQLLTSLPRTGLCVK